MPLLLSRRLLLLAAAGALLGLAGAPEYALAKGSGSGSGGGGSGSSGGGGDSGGGESGSDSSGKGGGDNGSGDNGGDDNGDNSGRGKYNDHKRAKDAVKNGSARPLPEILNVVSQRYPGKVIDVSLNRRSKVLMYDVKLITREGKLIRVRVDAETAVILGIKGI